VRLLICAGGTGGGVYPALSVLQALPTGDETIAQAGKQPEPGQRALISVLWIGGERGMEADLVKREGVPFATIPAAGVHGVGWRALPGNLAQLLQGFRAARRILSQFRPGVLLFTGGYLAVPMALAARLPLKALPRPRQMVYVPDIEPGLALKVLFRFADVVAVSVEETKKYLPSHKRVAVTGYPVRASLQKIDRSEACRFFGLDPELPVFLVLGGSKGARSINRALQTVLPQILTEMQVITTARGWRRIC
jgi:UDP-N-acetylglucosamine--N-acetylmuramyl-(pentapeptide) pyrophosphoryl-undecaprenol N-acetylglucosamine transferase